MNPVLINIILTGCVIAKCLPVINHIQKSIYISKNFNSKNFKVFVLESISIIGVFMYNIILNKNKNLA